MLQEEMEFFEKMIDKDCIKRITERTLHSNFKRMTYTEAIKELVEGKDDVTFRK